MTLDGHVYRITDAKTFFTPIVLGGGAPESGFEPWPQVSVAAHFYGKFLFFLADYENLYRVTGSGGAFSMSDPPASIVNLYGGPDDAYVSLSVNDGGRHLYRSGLFRLAEGDRRELDMYLYADTLPVSDGITAGSVSSVLGSSGLPGNTRITANPSGLSFKGSEGQVSLAFGISLTPDTSNDLDSFIDLTLSSWNISVDWPTSWVKSANDVLDDLRSGLAGAGSSVNDAVLTKMENVIETEDGLPSSLASKFFGNEVSVTFMDVGYPTSHSWGIGDTGDQTVVITADPCLGYPRDFALDPIKHSFPWWWAQSEGHLPVAKLLAKS